MNADVQLGPRLQDFKESTKDLSPALRGYRLSTDTFIRSIHNSFAQRMDMLNADLNLEDQADSEAKAKRRKQQTRKIKIVQKPRAKTESQPKKNENSSRPQRKRGPKVRGEESSKQSDSDESSGSGAEPQNRALAEAGYHFVAYVHHAATGRVWELDGLEKTPHMIGMYQ
jgi:hypothetical protein